MKKKPRPVVGDRSWSVDWCAGIPTDENGDSDHDRADDRCDRYRTLEAAQKRAAEVLPLDAFGCVSINECVFTAYDEDDAAEYPHAGFWDAVGEPTIVEAE